MLRIPSESGKWKIIIEDIEYSFYYSDAKPFMGLLMSGFDRQEKEYRIGNNIVSATKEDCIYCEQGFRYVLNIK